VAYKDLSLEDAGEMKRIEGAFVQWIKPWQARVNPMIAAIVLARCCRTVLRLCNPNDQKELTPILVAFLEGRVNPPKGEGSMIWTPDQGDVPGLM
jgi:hypothetical protein